MFYIVIENIEDWGSIPHVFTTMDKAQNYIRRYVAEEVFAHMEEDNSKKPLGDIIYGIETEEGKPSIINYVQFDKVGKNYISLEVVEPDTD